MSRVCLGACCLVLGLGTVLWFASSNHPFVSTSRPDPFPRSSSVAVLTSQADAGFSRVTGPRPFQFPRDHGPHPDYQTEWWYLTGNLNDGEGRRFGFQFTIFRFALVPSAEQRKSPWSTRQVYMGHFALTDPVGERFVRGERFSRASLDMAGAAAEPFQVWLHDWRLAGSPGFFPLRLTAAHDGVALDLVISTTKALVAQGDRGYSRKGNGHGNASHYYSFTRLEVGGTVTLEDRQVPVTGRAWLDREWSTSALEPDQVGWDWFALQLDDGRDLMFYQLRRSDGGTHPLSAGVIVGPQGEQRRLQARDVQVAVLARWTNRREDVYPAKWRLRVRGASDLDLLITPILADQEHPGNFRYWEGAVDVEGTRGERGVGYVELMGYASR